MAELSGKDTGKRPRGEKTAFFVYVQNDAKKRHTDSAIRVVHVMRFIPPLLPVHVIINIHG